MGEPVKTIDLARDMIRLSGLEPDRDIAIEVIGARPSKATAPRSWRTRGLPTLTAMASWCARVPPLP